MMRRMKLEAIQVESFETTRLPVRTGTVGAYESDPPFPDIPPSKGGTCEGTCLGKTCEGSCDCPSEQATCDTCQGPNCNGPVEA